MSTILPFAKPEFSECVLDESGDVVVAFKGAYLEGSLRYDVRAREVKAAYAYNDEPADFPIHIDAPAFEANEDDIAYLLSIAPEEFSATVADMRDTVVAFPKRR